MELFPVRVGIQEGLCVTPAHLEVSQTSCPWGYNKLVSPQRGTALLCCLHTLCSPLPAGRAQELTETDEDPTEEAEPAGAGEGSPAE